MKLTEWLNEKGTKRTQDALGQSVGLTQGRISQIASKGTNDLKTALAIEAATDGQVTVADLLMPAGKERESREPRSEAAA